MPLIMRRISLIVLRVGHLHYAMARGGKDEEGGYPWSI